MAIRIRADKAKLTILEKEMVTSGASRVFPVQFEFSEDWDGLAKTAVFEAGYISRAVDLDGDNMCDIPWEVLEAPQLTLFIGVRGTRDGYVVLPSEMEHYDVIAEGASLGKEALPPTPGLYDQLQGQIGDLSELQTTRKDNLVAAINEARNTGGGGGGNGVVPGHALYYDEEGRLSVRVADAPEQDNTLPITSAAVHTTVGNVEALLKTI